MRKQIATQASSRPFTQDSFDLKISLFYKYVEDLTYFDDELNPGERRQLWQDRITNGYLPFLEFVQSLFGDHVETRNVKAVFRKIAASPEAIIDWSELFGVNERNNVIDNDLLIKEQADKTTIFLTDEKYTVGIAGGDKRSHENVQCLTYCCKLNIYVTVTLHGIICQWNSRFRLKSSIEIAESTWVTGCCTLPDLKKVVVSTERSIVIWDYRMKGKDKLILYINPIENPPHCLERVPWKNIPSYQDSIVYGDDQGCLNLLTITAEDMKEKTTKQSKEGTWNVLDPGKLKNAIVRQKVHSDWVGQVKYFGSLHMVVSCCSSNQNSLVLSNLDYFGDERFQRSLSLPKGINCFAYCTKANAIVTGGVDKVLRIWHPLILTRPTGKLLGHVFTIMDITVNERDQHVISISSARVFRVWDIQRLQCLQVFVFSESQLEESKSCCVFFDNKHEYLVTGTNVLEIWPLSKKSSDDQVHPHSHDKAVTCILFNLHLSQVATTCKEGCLKIWEIETGQLIHCRPEAHGSKTIIITAMTSDIVGQRLITGGNNGSVCVWDFVNAQLLKSCRNPRNDGNDLPIQNLCILTNNSESSILVTSRREKVKILTDLKLNSVLKESQFTSEELYSSSQMITKSDSNEAERLQIPLTLSNSDVIAVHCDARAELLALGFADTSVEIWGLSSQVLLMRTNHQREKEKENISAIQMIFRSLPEILRTEESKERDNKQVEPLDSPFVTTSSSPERMTNTVKVPSLKNVSGVIIVTFKSGNMEVYSIKGDLLAAFNAFPTSVHQKYVQKITSLDDAFRLATGDSGGFITLWDLTRLHSFKPISLDVTENSAIEQSVQSYIKRSIEQTFVWSAHLTKITDLAYVQVYDIIISSSTDGSVRVWHRTNGHFLGYFGQSTAWNFGRGIDVPLSPEKPYDIRQKPLQTLRGTRVSMEQSKPTNLAKIPLAFDARRWNIASCPPAIQGKADGDFEKKFFSSLKKPRHYNSHLEFSTTASSESGAVFRSLPVYKIHSPKRLKTPAVNLREPSWLMVAKGPTHTNKKKRHTVRLKTSKKEGRLLSRFPHLVSGKR